MLPVLLNAFDTCTDSTLRDSVAAVVPLLAEWDGERREGSIGYALYREWVHSCVVMTFEDELGPFLKEADPGFLVRCISTDSSRSNVSRDYFDDTRTEERETRESVMLRALNRAVFHLELAHGMNPERWGWKAPTVHIRRSGECMVFPDSLLHTRSGISVPYQSRITLSSPPHMISISIPGQSGTSYSETTFAGLGSASIRFDRHYTDQWGLSFPSQAKSLTR